MWVINYRGKMVLEIYSEINEDPDPDTLVGSVDTDPVIIIWSDPDPFFKI